MSITREDVADLREGDVVELTFASGSVIRGPLTENRHCAELSIADVGWTVRDEDGDMGFGLERYAETLTVVCRAPRPLYVNHPRTKPVPGDFARDEDADGIRLILRMSSVGRRDEAWYDQDGTERTYERVPGRRLRLLVDGETGQVVP